jgi:hypothetical protein
VTTLLLVVWLTLGTLFMALRVWPHVVAELRRVRLTTQAREDVRIEEHFRRRAETRQMARRSAT